MSAGLGLLTGAALGAGLGILFAPKRESKLRAAASATVDAGRETYAEAVDTVSRAAKDVGRYVNEIKETVTRAF